ncbi:MAG: MFS transporter [Porticoccaceae bacterium]|jgi:MFS family permease|nr:MFS transporter [Porticoccaceae bacterium]MBT3799187.1 MFS transporter [Porticoccaceae bacterium]MBT4163786.1 MFS transporter [Porticoccaceae bacterium]MBT4210762.1 MFS transporter [Porticoccaceae bacterium]MBT5003380.1 MFS transporter [Porticoccaceae bacterium]
MNLSSTPVSGDQKNSSWPSESAAWYTVGLLFVAYTFSFVDRFILTLLIEPIKQDFNLSDTGVSLLIGFAFVIFYTFLGIPIGRLADRVNRRNLIVAGITLWSCMTALCGMARGFGSLFVARIGVGVGEAALSPAAYSMIADLFPPKKLGRALSVYTAGAFVGVGLALIVGGLVVQSVTSSPEIVLPIIGTIRSWQAPFFIVGLPGLLVAALMYTVREPERREQKLSNTEGGHEAVTLKEAFAYIGQRWKVYMAHFFGFALLGVSSNVLFVWGPHILVRSFGLPVGEAGASIGIIVLTFGTMGLLAGGFMSDRLLKSGYLDNGMRVGIVAALCGIPFALLLPLMGSLSSLFMVFCPLVLFSCLGFGSAAAALQQVTPNRLRGVVSGCYFFLLNVIGIGLSPSITAVLTNYVFQDELKLVNSVSLMAVSSSILAALILWRGLKSYRTEVAVRIDLSV